MKPLKQLHYRRRFPGIAVLLFVCVLTLFTRPVFARQPLNTACPLDFFTNVASRLLSSQLNVNLDQIQIYPTNQYTPAVHRLLQVTANILDATTTNYYPSVFRPLFWKTNEECMSVWQTNIYIVGYQFVQEPLGSNNPPIFNTPTDPGDVSVPFGLSGFTNNIYGIPWVIGVKKGLPNFNGLELDNCFFIERLLQFTRNSSAPSSGSFPFGRIYTTNQMYVVGVSNIFAMEDWNSYSSTYTNPVTIVAQQAFSFGLSNDAPGFVSVKNTAVLDNFNSPLETNAWPGEALVLPLGTNTIFQNLSPPDSQETGSTNNLYIYFDGSTYPSTNINGVTYTAPCFIPALGNSATFVNVGTPLLPHLVLDCTNRLQAYIIDSNNCILDYVQLAGPVSTLDLNSAIADPDGEFSGLWTTNVYGGTETPFGVVEQFLVSTGAPFPAAEDGDEAGTSEQIGWTTAPIPGLGNLHSVAAQQAYFEAFFTGGDAAVDPADGDIILTNIALTIQAPFTPKREIVQRSVYTANDPLVHYLTEDLADFLDDTNSRYALSLQPPTIKYLGAFNDRYMPWGVAGNLAEETLYGVPADNNPYNLSYKDPLVASSDDWDFPTNQTLNASWLGQVHRGTPWQTIFLKSTNILALQTPNPSGLSTWALWTGDTNLFDAVSMAPPADWRMAALLASLIDTNAESSLFSANDPRSGDWENLLNGMTALTNDLNDLIVQFEFESGYGAELVPLTVTSNSTQAAEIANAIESTRATLPGQFFFTPGNIFAVPQLSDESPYLNLDEAQVEYGISDQAYEAIPDQLLPLLRVDSIGSMTAAKGQVVIQFTGDDNSAYAIQSSPDLVNWTTVSTNCPVNGVFTFTNSGAANTQFYRTVLLY
jgi:hypothetical protein